MRVKKKQTARNKEIVSLSGYKPVSLNGVGYDGYILKSEVGMRNPEVKIGKLSSALRGLAG